MVQNSSRNDILRENLNLNVETMKAKVIKDDDNNLRGNLKEEIKNKENDLSNLQSKYGPIFEDT